jgi:hypothetical protein
MRIPTFVCQRFELLEKGLHYFYDFENWNMDILGKGDLVFFGTRQYFGERCIWELLVQTRICNKHC